MTIEYDFCEVITPEQLTNRLNEATKQGWKAVGITSHNRNGVHYLVALIEREIPEQTIDAFDPPPIEPLR